MKEVNYFEGGKINVHSNEGLGSTTSSASSTQSWREVGIGFYMMMIMMTVMMIMLIGDTISVSFSHLCCFFFTSCFGKRCPLIKAVCTYFS